MPQAAGGERDLPAGRSLSLMAHIEFFQLVAGSARNGTGQSSWPHAGGLVFAVAEGEGPGEGAREARTSALEIVARELELSFGSWPLPTRLRRAVQRANMELHARALTVPDLRGMGTALTVTALDGERLVTAHVGHCRLYRLRDVECVQLTKDDGRDDAADAPGGARRLGRELVVPIDVLSAELREGDVILQCSPAVGPALHESGVREALTTLPAEAACRRLVRQAKTRGPVDALSVQVAAIRSLGEAPRARWWRTA